MRAPRQVHRLLTPPHLLRVLFCVCALTGCGSEAATPREQTQRGGPPEPPTVPEPRDPAFPLVDDSPLRRAPGRYDHIVPRLTMPATGTRFRNLVYEANNLTLRGGHGEDGLFEDTGGAIADRWRESAAGVRGVMALRDALFSQQDHPVENDPVAVVMPASWVSVAANEVIEGRALRPVLSPAIDDDERWAAIDSANEMFGSFPRSDTLFAVATRPRTVLAPERLRVTNARRSVAMLARGVQGMLDAQADGVEAVAAAGAEAIAASDQRYFGERLRREHMILISVENPNAHERVEEAKGFDPPGFDVSEEAMRIARRAVFRRRLQAGDIGLERYDLSSPTERRHARAILEELVGHQQPGRHRVWIFVHGGMNATGTTGPDWVPHILMFRNSLDESTVDLSRVQFVGRPHIRIGGSNLARKLDQSARRMRNHGLPLNLSIGTGLLGRLFEELGPDR